MRFNSCEIDPYLRRYFGPKNICPEPVDPYLQSFYAEAASAFLARMSVPRVPILKTRVIPGRLSGVTVEVTLVFSE